MSEPTNLSQKFAEIKELMTTQHNALMQKIEALRGEGPENNIKSINQSIWNLAGPAPGASLFDLQSKLQKIIDTFGDPSVTYPMNMTVRYLLSQILDAITANGTTETDAKAILVRLIAQFDTSVVVPTMKDLLLTIKSQQEQLIDGQQQLIDGQEQLIDQGANPIITLPKGCCTTPLVSTGSSYSVVSAEIIEPYTVATWPQTPGGDFTTYWGVLSAAYSSISCADWSKYRVYVASKSDVFGLAWITPIRYPCNQWVTIPGNAGQVDFVVMGDNDLKVYICPVSTGTGTGGLVGCDGATGPLTVAGWAKWDWNLIPNHAAWFASVLDGGAGWAHVQDTLIEGVNAQTSLIVNADATDAQIQLCFAWNTTNEPDIDLVGLKAYGYDGQVWSEIGNVGISVSVAARGSAGHIGLDADSLGMGTRAFADVAFVPFIASATVSVLLAPDVSFGLAWIPPGAAII